MKLHKRAGKILLPAITLTALSACTTENTAATTTGLASDLARQLLTFWFL